MIAVKTDSRQRFYHRYSTLWYFCKVRSNGTHPLGHV